MADATAEIAELYAYDRSEQATFAYLRRYMDLVAPRLDAILADPARRRRFMLAGLVLPYRAANHQGLVLTTAPRADAFRDPRIEGFSRLGGGEIRDTADYLRQLGPTAWTFRLPGAGARLFQFVWGG